MHAKNIVKSGNTNATKALIMLHGRGSNANDILGLANSLNVGSFALYAPNATNSSWYPNSFMANPETNEPWLSSALELVSQTIEEVRNDGITMPNIFFVGFSQGACLACEYLGRNAARYGGAAIFTGGLIGDRIYGENYAGHFESTPIFITTSNPDFHVPVERVYETANIFKAYGAEVTEKVYDNMGHTIIPDQLHLADMLIFNRPLQQS